MAPVQVCKDLNISNVTSQVLGSLILSVVPELVHIIVHRRSIAVSSLEPETQRAVKKHNPNLQTVYYNKGL